MTEDDFYRAMREHQVVLEEREATQEQDMMILAFVIHRFCGGKIEYPLEEFMDSLERIDIQRTYRDGKVTYVTRGPDQDQLT